MHIYNNFLQANNQIFTSKVNNPANRRIRAVILFLVARDTSASEIRWN